MKPVRHAVRVVVIQDDKLLCLRYNRDRLHDYLDLPGGKIESGETVIDACVRETREETGLTITPDSLRPVGRITNDTPEKIYDLQVFTADRATGDLYNSEGDEALWLPLNEVRAFPKRLVSARLVDEDLLPLLEAGDFDIQFVSDASQNIVSQQILQP